MDEATASVDAETDSLIQVREREREREREEKIGRFFMFFSALLDSLSTIIIDMSIIIYSTLLD